MKFSKMQATGNDFIIIDARKMRRNWPELAKDMCHRHFGVGADGLITVNMQSDSLSMRIFNTDGSEAEVCGNGLRCFAKYVSDYKLNDSVELDIETNSGLKKAYLFKTRGSVTSVKVDMGMPRFGITEIPLNPVQFTADAASTGSKAMIQKILSIEGRKLDLNFISMGNPHAVAFIKDDIEELPLNTIGPIIERHIWFPNRTNFEIAHIEAKDRIRARVWERGVGETLACGSGACAIAVAAVKKGYANEKVDIIMPGGILTIIWNKKESVFLRGGVEEVFTGTWLK
ncbi:MAG TPA: diaminopimelate epimerase [Dehalococcoidia bacterium]|nr:diaminopimelate epimerase [Dehalococcoidia bacterium]